jgi:hypothetical protein
VAATDNDDITEDANAQNNGRCSPSISSSSEKEDDQTQFVIGPSSAGGAPQPNRRTSQGNTMMVPVGGDAGESFGGAGETISEECTAVDSYPVWCVVLYDYHAVNADELSIEEDEMLEIIGAGDGDGWLKARNSAGYEGLVPENYIRVWNPVDDVGDNDTNEVNVDTDLDNSTGGVVKAMYDYTATCDEELSFNEGDLILIKSKEPNGVDDGWWVGEVHGSVGVFPSLMVQELTPEHTMDMIVENGSMHQLQLQHDAVDIVDAGDEGIVEAVPQTTVTAAAATSVCPVYQPSDTSSTNLHVHGDQLYHQHLVRASSAESWATQGHDRSKMRSTGGRAASGSAVGSSVSRSVVDLQYLFTEGAESSV